MKSNKYFRFVVLLVAILAFSILSGCDDSGGSSGNNKIGASFEGGYYHTTSSDGYRLDFKDGVCTIYYSPNLSTEQCVGQSPFSETTDTGVKRLVLDESIGLAEQKSFTVINDGEYLKNNLGWQYTRFPSSDYNWLNH
jgi:hypothetical protein